ncbi:MAG: Rieske 2Fe-2S domain-containing protein [Ilumatobacteraceae bacterium]
MQATSLGHAGILIRCRQATIVCDPWFVPAFLGSWFPFPRNDQLDPELMSAVCAPDYLYISHLHGDHFDESFLRERMSKHTRILLPAFPTDELRRRLTRLGFHDFVTTHDGEELPLGNGLSVAIHIESSISDGPGGDSAIVVKDGESCLVNQNDCRTHDPHALARHGRVDQHWLQFSGAIWYPMVYDMPMEQQREQATAKVDSQFVRAEHYVEAIGATTVIPSAGPPCFLDDDLFSFNMIDGNEISIFPDQSAFIERLSKRGWRAERHVPGTTIASVDGEVSVTHPTADIDTPFSDKRNYLLTYKADWQTWLDAEKASWPAKTAPFQPRLAAWLEPLLLRAPRLRAGVGGRCLIRSGDEDVVIDFPSGTVRNHTNDEVQFRFEIAPELLEKVISEFAVDWSNSLFLSCRFRAWREGPFNEYLYNFFKSLSVERIDRAEAEAVRRLGDAPAQTDEIQLGDFTLERYCPHRKADLSVFGRIEGDDVVCTLHGWRFRTSDGRCVTADDRKLQIRRTQ